ncbi:tagaturonate epimerase family protein [Paenibacillus filicis]|uniref:Tagaturonate/fructuronate epimerase n=1 Tax=Paenibacillus gyeongsangnamensis TaxID=3388067 RepID=A0ABT4QBM7_9BACL|nr:tagaturonate epimerase family protein [Paenibacillus filicis]MCZ8514162.1 tagaturonate epimerase family protein [Paenibacillus filicis]
MGKFQAIIEALAAGKVSDIGGGDVKVYAQSLAQSGGTKLLMVKDTPNHTKYILAAGEGPLYDELQGQVEDGAKISPLTHENRLVLNKYFDYTVPRAFGTQIATIGLGDRLGIASPGHIKTVQGRDVRPILAQQSIRELNLTGRDYKQVVDAACYAVFQEGYKDGFGADGDHLKVEADIEMALDLGFTMLTLDCSEKIDNTIEGTSEAEQEAKYAQLPEAVRSHYEARYLNQTFPAAGTAISFDRPTLIKNVLIYGAAIDFMEHIYTTYIKNAARAVDFEISIDETATPTAPESHFFVAKELYSRGLTIYSMAPRFCGEFQKGIDYIGDLEQFEKELIIHAGLADDFGYKLSIHSGSDKFSVFPVIGKYTKGRFHVKTAGTNWLEAVRTVAKVNPSLYRRMHQYALEHFEEATAYYHVSTDLSKIAPLDQVSDADLADTYMNEDNARQLIHITYGILLQAKDAAGNSLFKDEFFRTLSEQEEAYEQSLISHIGKHLDLLGK